MKGDDSLCLKNYVVLLEEWYIPGNDTAPQKKG